ncbi:hypothetical protein [Methanobacterium oryzae]|uniref:hypothetical protein n=1 Tax=Methanobacterium oryzae TaxID=69540 RepID=UPI003D1BCA62
MKKQITLTILFLIGVLVSVSACSAATLTVGTGETYLNISSAVDAANDGDTIFIKNGTYNGEGNTQISIDKNINITGQSQTGTILDGENDDYFFYIYSSYTVTINNLTFEDGGDTWQGSAINNGGTLNLIDCTFISNDAEYEGGAIYNENILDVQNCKFINNTATYCGGAILNNGDMTVTGSTFTGNTADWGGAIFNWYNSIVNGGIFNNNNAESGGGAICSCGTLTATGCNFYNNTAGEGGAIYSYTYDTPSYVNVKYSRFVGNTAENTQNDIYQWSGIQVANTLITQYNWWGSNNGPASERITGDSNNPVMSSMYTPWLVMNINPADPDTIYTGETSKISVNVYTDSNGVNHSADAAQFFSGPEVTFTTDLGNVGSKEVTVPWTLGMAFAILRGDEGTGIATVTAADANVPLSTTVNILQAPVTPDEEDEISPSENEVNAASNTVGMQETGIPIAGLILAMLTVFAGLATSKRK